MKTILITLMVSIIAFFFINCNNGSKVVKPLSDDTNKVVNYKIVGISKSEYDKFMSKALNFDFDTSLFVKKVGGEINLILDNGSVKTFSDTLVDTDNADKRLYYFKGILPKTKIYVICAQYYESTDYILVNKTNGETITAWDIPKISPDKKHIASAYGALGYDVVHTGIQILKNDNNILSTYLEIEFTDFEPADIYWVDERTLIFKKEVPEENTNRFKSIKYAKLILL